MKQSPFLVFILPTLGLLAVGQVITKHFAKSPPVSLHSSWQRHELAQRAVLAEKEVSGEKGKVRLSIPVTTDPNRGSGSGDQSQRSVAANYDKLINPFVKQVKAEELIEAEQTLAAIEDELPFSIRSALHLTLESAREARKVKATARAEREKRELALAMVEVEKERRVRSVAEAKEETEKVDKVRLEVEQHLVKMQADNAERISRPRSRS